MKMEEVGGGVSDPLSADEARAIVLLFVSVDCPIVNSYAPKLRRLSETFAAKGVVFRLVYPNHDEDQPKIQRHLLEYNLPFTAYRDLNHHLVRAAQVSVTPEAAVYVPGKGWLYHGRIDNRFVALGKMRSVVTQEDLQEVLTAILENRPVKVGATRAVGCSIASQP